MADADGSLGSNHPTVRSRVEMLTDDTPAPSQRRAPVARSPIRISGAPARMTADGTNVAKPEIVMRSRTSKPAVGPGDHNYMDPDEAELFFLPESKAYPTEMPPGELRNLICSILPAEALGDCTINSDIRAKIDCVVQTNPDFMNSTQSAVNRVLQTLTRKADQREEGMALILAAVAEDVNRMFSHESPLLLTFGMIAQAHLHQNFIAFHTEIGDWAGKKPAVLSELDESMMALLEILENGCANVKEMTAMLLAVREEETEMLRKRSRIGNEAFYSEEHKAEREDFMKISSDMSSRRNQFTSARDMFTKDMVNAVCLFIGRSPPATATRVIKPLSVPAKVSDEPNARMAKQFCNNVIDYMVQEPENAYISMAVIHYLFEKIHTYDQPIAPYMDNGSVKGPMIELPDVCIEQYEIESTLMAKYMRRHHPDLMRKFGRGASLSSAENSDPVSFETEREDGIGGLMSVIFTHAERKTSHKLELRDDIERFAGKFVSGPLQPQFDALLTLIEEGLNMQLSVSYEMTAKAIASVLADRAQVFSTLQQQFSIQPDNDLRIDPLNACYKLINRAEHVIRETQLPENLKAGTSSASVKLAVRAGIHHGTDSGSGSNSSDTPICCSAAGCSKNIDTNQVKRITKLLEKDPDKKPTALCNECHDTVKKGTNVTLDDGSIREGWTTEYKEQNKLRNLKSKQAKAKKVKAAKAAAENTDDASALEIMESLIGDYEEPEPEPEPGAGFKKSDLEAMKKLPVDEKRAKLKEYFEYRKSQVGSAKAVNARHLNF